jgi:hypothetical protein
MGAELSFPHFPQNRPLKLQVYPLEAQGISPVLRALFSFSKKIRFSAGDFFLLISLL